MAGSASAARRSSATPRARTTSAPADRRAGLAVVERRPRVTRTAILVTLMAVVLAFGALAVQVSLIHRQQQLDEVRSEITELQLANKELRQQESRLQSPSEILRIARDELGMVESRPAELVSPQQQTVGTATGQG